MVIVTHSEPGIGHGNQDYLMVAAHPVDPAARICTLADGQGGTSHGELAARAACEAIQEKAAAMGVEELLSGATWNRLIERADLSAGRTGGLTTLVAYVVSRSSIAGASSGDSRVYFASREAPELVELTSRQRKGPPVGSGEARPVVFNLDLAGGGRVVAVSDGIWKYCGHAGFAESFRIPLGEIMTYLRDSIEARSGGVLPDDASLIAIDIDPPAGEAGQGARWSGAGISLPSYCGAIRDPLE